MKRRISCFLVLAFLGPAGISRASSYEIGWAGSTRDYGRSLDVGDPISAATGAHHFRLPLLNLGGPLDLGFGLFYRSDLERWNQELPNKFWWAPFGALGFETISNVPYARAHLPDCRQIAFVQNTNDGTWSLTGPAVQIPGFTYTDNVPRVQYRLQVTETHGYVADPAAARLCVFAKTVTGGGVTNFRIRRIVDRNTNALVFSFDATGYLVTNVADGLGRSLDLAYTNMTQTGIRAVTDQAGRGVAFAYENQGLDNNWVWTLRSITNAAGGPIRFGYGCGSSWEAHFITNTTLPRGNVPYTRDYFSLSMYDISTMNRVMWELDAYSNRTSFSYALFTNPLTITFTTGVGRATNRIRHSSSHGFPVYLTDAGGATIHFTQDTNGHLRSVTDRLGGTTAFDYEPASGLLAGVSNAAGAALRFTYAPRDQVHVDPDDGDAVTNVFFDLARIDYPDGTFEGFTCDGSGNLLVYSNRLGPATRYAYEGHGWVTQIVNAVGGTVALAWLPGGVLASRSESGGGTNRYESDSLFRLTNVVFPDGTTAATEYDALDQVVAHRLGDGAVWQIAYDANGNVSRLTDPLGRAATFEYDLMDRLTAFTNRSGAGEHYTYDSGGWLESHIDPNGIRTEYGHDADGQIDRYVLGGATWQIARNAEALVESITSPLGHVRRYARDVLGDVVSVTDPLGQTTSYTRDDERRVTGIEDPLGRAAEYAYDAGGQLIHAQGAGMAPATYHRNSLGLVDLVTDPLGREWAFACTSMGRLQSRTDPLTNVWTYGYDLLGRCAEAVAPDGTTNGCRYDSAGRVTNLAYATGLSLFYAYDELGQLVATDGLAWERDAEGRITNSIQSGVSFGATYDAGGRLVSVSGNGGALVVNYEYDPTNGLLRSVTDSLSGGGMRLEYDADQRPTAWIRSNGVHAAFTWDAAARLARLQDGTVLDLVFSRDSAGQVTQQVATLPLGPQALIASSVQSNSFDAASQLQTAGHAYDRLGRLTAAPGMVFTWDGASRLTGINGAVLACNGLDELTVRTEGSRTNEYFRNHAIPNAPIVAERVNGVWTRYYVWTPGGALLYLVDAGTGASRYYHFDPVGSTLALTDAAGAVTDAYAYDPFGRPLGRTGTSEQPFTFLGRQGVRTDGTAGLCQMRARWYDAGAGRFLSREPLWPVLALPAALNPYLYALNNPADMVDADGLAPVGATPLLQALENLAGEYQQAAAASQAAGHAHAVGQVHLKMLEVDPANNPDWSLWAQELKLGDPNTVQRRALEATLEFWKAKQRERAVRARLLEFAAPHIPAMRKALNLMRNDLAGIRKQQALFRAQAQKIRDRRAELHAEIGSAEAWYEAVLKIGNAGQAAEALRNMMKLEKEMQDLGSQPRLPNPECPESLLEQHDFLAQVEATLSGAARMDAIDK
jgi:RHS repeat-associated protein